LFSLVASLKNVLTVPLVPDQVYMNSSYGDFLNYIITNERSGGKAVEAKYETVKMHVNGMDISMPTQLFINGVNKII
jgi:hypothetical protein